MNQHVMVHLQGIVPLIVNRYSGEQLPEPKPKTKTQGWLDSQHRKKWIAAAWFTPFEKENTADKTGMFAIPPVMIECALFQAAAGFRKRKEFKMSVMCADLEIPILVNSGNGKYAPVKGQLGDFYAEKGPFVDLRGCPNARKQMVEQCRPIFRDWAIEFNLVFDDQAVDAKDVKQACSTMILGSFRPRYGRSELKDFQVLKVAKAA